ncbi:prepilin-type N-terminal cleavage/methylation domain-containing protein [Candidatus Falkowbacteria bacterium]|nr:prepilin-type N-terminal cleavage/methylation domain-containing protein [Candidatus Falkowbacteria bacterium]
MVDNKRKSGAGFTLIELLVVIAIIGLLTTLAVVALNSARQKARDAKRVADVKQIQTSLELYFNDATSYPVVGGPSILGVEYDCLGGDGLDLGACTEPIYMGLIPGNPGPGGAPYLYESLGSTGAGCTTGPCAAYQITFELEGVAGEFSAGPVTANQDGMSQ